jgi:glucose/mannose transport system substrate-binding protein
MRKSIIITIVAIAIVVSGLVCFHKFSGQENVLQKEGMQKPEIEAVNFYHWWVSPGESAALQALINVFANKYPGVAILPTSVSGKNEGGGSFELFNVVQPMILAGQAPDAFQMNGGYSGQRYVDGDYLEKIDEIWESENLEEVTHLIVQEICKFNGHYYAIPVNIHRTNVIWYNKKILDENGIDPKALTSWKAFFEATDKLKEGGMESPIQMGRTWTAAQVFEGIIASIGIEFYEDFIGGKVTNKKDTRIIEAFEIFEKYLKYVNPDNTEINWDTATKRIIKGEGAFNIMGDWNNGEFESAGLKYGTDYGVIPIPGTEELYGMGVDTFQRPKGAVHPKGSQRWLKVVASKEGQDAFNPLKGSISARIDSDTIKYGQYQQNAIKDFWDARYMYPTLSNGAPVLFVGSINEALAEFIEKKDKEKSIEKITNFAKEFNDTFTRKWTLY